MKQEKVFTWADMKRVVNKIPDSRINDRVVIWTEEQETANFVTGVEILPEDYHDDGDIGTWPKSTMKENLKADKEYTEEDFPVIYPKGTRIINAI